jgi:hypothetical protein
MFLSGWPRFGPSFWVPLADAVATFAVCFVPNEAPAREITGKGVTTTGANVTEFFCDTGFHMRFAIKSIVWDAARCKAFPL